MVMPLEIGKNQATRFDVATGHRAQSDESQPHAVKQRSRNASRTSMLRSTSRCPVPSLRMLSDGQNASASPQKKCGEPLTPFFLFAPISQDRLLVSGIEGMNALGTNDARERIRI